MIQEGKVRKEIPKSSRFLIEDFNKQLFVFLDTEDITPEPLNKGGITE